MIDSDDDDDPFSRPSSSRKQPAAKPRKPAAKSKQSAKRGGPIAFDSDEDVPARKRRR